MQTIEAKKGFGWKTCAHQQWLLEITFKIDKSYENKSIEHNFKNSLNWIWNFFYEQQCS
jgi:hypothetical protein